MNLFHVIINEKDTRTGGHAWLSQLNEIPQSFLLWDEECSYKDGRFDKTQKADTTN